MKSVNCIDGATKAGLRRLHVARPRVRGLTIIELMTVMIVLGVLVSIAIAPAISGMVGSGKPGPAESMAGSSGPLPVGNL